VLVLRRHVVAEDRAAPGGAQALRLLEVLDADGQAVQRAEGVAAHHRLLRGLRGVAGAAGVHRGHRVDRRVDRLDARQAALQQLDRREGLAADEAARLDGAEVAGLGHGAASSFS
jgi:hypothetical protein